MPNRTVFAGVFASQQLGNGSIAASTTQLSKIRTIINKSNAFAAAILMHAALRGLSGASTYSDVFVNSSGSVRFLVD